MVRLVLPSAVDVFDSALQGTLMEMIIRHCSGTVVDQRTLTRKDVSLSSRGYYI